MENNLEKIGHLLKENSDFSFEMRVLNEVNKQGYKTEHSGTYLDPYTGMNREFDIRATKMIDDDKEVRLSIECKNISSDVPVVIHSVPNSKLKSYHTLIIEFEDIVKELEEKESAHSGFAPPIMTNFLKGAAMASIKVEYSTDASSNVYKSNYSDFEYIGKSIDKIAIKNKGQKNEKFILNDEEIYNKYSQAINSVCDLIKDTDKKTDYPAPQYFIQPVFVVPDNSLLEIQYNDKGEIVEGSPKNVNRVPLYIGKNFSERELGRPCVDHEIRYLEVVTESGLKALLESYESNKDFDFEPTFISRHRIQNVVAKAVTEYREM